MNTNLSAIWSLHAELSLAAVLLVVFVADLFRRPESGGRWFRVMVCILMGLQMLFTLTPDTRELFGGMYVNTPFTSVVKSLLSAATLLVFLQSGEWLGRNDTRCRQGEFYVLTLSTLLGMFFMLSSGHFLMFYIGLETASIPVACMVALDKYRHHGHEAGAKFILSSMFSSALLLYGLSLIYGACGTLYFQDVASSLSAASVSGEGLGLQVMALALFVAGMGFKMSLVPFHLWTADVYEGAPTGVAAYLSVVSKGAAAVALAVVLRFVFQDLSSEWGLGLAWLSVVSITVANVMAILQNDLKRFMAFSSISQAGYIVLGILAGTAHGFASLAYYVAVYVVANVCVFAVLGTVEQHTGGLTGRDAYRGLYRTNPRLTLALTLSLFSLGGIPPFAGFFSKFFIFSSAFAEGWWWVVFVALLNTIISLYYYLLIVKAMYIETPVGGECAVAAFRSSPGVRVCIVLCMAGVCLLGLWSGLYEGLTHWAGLLPF